MDDSKIRGLRPETTNNINVGKTKLFSLAPSWLRYLGWLLFVALTAGCLSQRTQLSISGATTVMPLFMALAPEFEAANPGIVVTITSGGSTVGILDVATGNAHIGAAAREPSFSEQSRVIFIPLAQDQIAIVAHQSVERNDVTVADLAALSRGQSVDGLEGRTFIGKASAHGTYQAFQRSLGMEGEPLSADAVAGSNGEVLKLVAATSGIGYVSFADASRAIAAREPIKILSVNGVTPGLSSQELGTYPLTRTLYFLLPRPGLELGFAVYPLAADFLELLRSHKGQNMIREAGFIPVT